MTDAASAYRVAFPLEEVSEHSRREKNVRHGHISTCTSGGRRDRWRLVGRHLRLVVDDPPTVQSAKNSSRIDDWRAGMRCGTGAVVRSRDEGAVADGRDLLQGHATYPARQQRYAPRLLDPRAARDPAGALRLGCDVEASDMNPVAGSHEGTVEYPQKYADLWGAAREAPTAAQGERPGARLHPRGANASKKLRRRRRGRAYEKNPLAAEVRYWVAGCGRRLARS